MTNAQHPLIIGIDGGGTGCRVAILRGETVVGDAVGGPANVTSDRDGALSNIRGALDAAMAVAGVLNLDEAVAHAGLAGVLHDTDTRAIAAAIPVGHVTVSDDRLTSVVGALGVSDGVLVSVGTGSFVAHQSAGDVQFIGGWGLNIGDQASGAWLGKRLIETVALAVDGITPRSDLIDSVFAEFSDTPSKLIDFARTSQPSDYARFAPRIVKAASQGDVQGRAIMRAGAEYLTSCINMLATDTSPICLTGSVGPHYADHLETHHVRRLIAPKGSALDGALRLAIEAAAAAG